MKLLILILIIPFLISCSDTNSRENRSKNIQFLKNTLGPVVIEYYKKHGVFPEFFDDALQEYQETLPNRGDAFGQSLVYERISMNSFYFHSYGSNGQNDNGKEDDLVVTYIDNKWYIDHPLPEPKWNNKKR